LVIATTHFISYGAMSKEAGADDKICRVAVAGAVGKGKSLHLGKLTGNEAMQDGDESEGTTKEISSGTFVNPKSKTVVEIIDPPGIGDQDVKPFDLFQMYEKHLKGQQIDAVLLFLDVRMPRFGIEGDILCRLMELCFPDKGDEKWKNFIAVGTFKDEASQKQIELFSVERLNKSLQKVVPTAQLKYAVMVGPGDYDSLFNALQTVETEGDLGQYRLPDATKFVTSMAQSMGVQEDKMEEFAATFAKHAQQSEAAMQMMQNMMDKQAAASDEKEKRLYQLLEEQMRRPREVVQMPGAGPAVVPVPACSVM